MAFHRPASDDTIRFFTDGPLEWTDLDRARARRDAKPFLAKAKEDADFMAGPKPPCWGAPDDEPADHLASIWGISLAENDIVPAFGVKCDGDQAMGVLWALLNALIDHELFARDEAVLRAAHRGCGFHLSRRAVEMEADAEMLRVVRERDRQAQAQLALRRRVADPRRGRR